MTGRTRKRGTPLRPVPFSFLPEEKNGFSLQMESIPGHWPFSRDQVTTKRTKKARENSPDCTKGAVIEVTSIWHKKLGQPKGRCEEGGVWGWSKTVRKRTTIAINHHSGWNKPHVIYDDQCELSTAWNVYRGQSTYLFSLEHFLLNKKKAKILRGSQETFWGPN